MEFERIKFAGNWTTKPLTKNMCVSGLSVNFIRRLLTLYLSQMTFILFNRKLLKPYIYLLDSWTN